MYVLFEHVNADMQALLASDLGENPARWENVIYRATDCGAWLQIGENAVTVGSIVEGSDAEFAETLHWPFSLPEFWAAVKRIDKAACEAWLEAND